MPFPLDWYHSLVFAENRSGSGTRTALVVLVVFSVAMGFLEAAVAYYLRLLIGARFNAAVTHYRTLVNLGFIEFVRPAHALLFNQRVTTVETVREAATLVMLCAVGFFCGRTWRQRVGALLVSFACWDLSYYGFLKVIDRWPSSLLTKDVYFMIPVAWVGPVITPIVIAMALLVTGTTLFLREPRRRR